MRPHPLLASLVLLAACAQVPPRSTPAAEPPPASERWAVHVEIPAVPAGARRVVVALRRPGPEVALESATGLVGNALCEFPLQARGGASEARVGPATLRPGAAPGELEIETDGKPVELELRFSAAASADSAALERALAEAVQASIDGRPVPAAVRLARVR